MFCNPCMIRKPYTPSSTDVEEVLSKVDKILGQLKEQIAAGKKSQHKKRIEDWEAEVKKLKEPKAGGQTADIPMKDGKVDKETWDKKPEDEQRKTWETLTTAYEELRCLNVDSLKQGKCYFLIFSTLLALVVAIYLGLHLRTFKGYIQTTLTSQESIEMWDLVRLIDLKLTDLKEKKKLAEKSAEKPAEKPKFSEQGSTGQPKAQEKENEIENSKTEIKKSLTDLRARLYRLPLPFETIKLLGAVSAELEADDPTVYVTYPTLIKHLGADLEGLSTAYFWTLQPWRWLELALWATMGCLVGLLFYVAGLLGQGIFRCEEGFMFWAELLIAPIVVPVVFFLFAMTGITDFVPTQASVTVNIGVAFIFGFAIRRTIGLLDIIKKRFFPDPSPGSASPGS